MAELILSGGGSPKLKNPKQTVDLDSFLIKLIKKENLLYLPQARERETYPSCLDWIKTKLNPLGFNNITMWESLKNRNYQELKRFRAVYIGGGNTFKLLKEIKESGFDKLLKKFIKEKGIVYGSSAGAIIFGKNILTSHDENEVKLKDVLGFNLADNHSIWCHYQKREDKKILSYVSSQKIPVIALPEGSGIYLKDGRITPIGRKKIYLFTEKKKEVLI